MRYRRPGLARLTAIRYDTTVRGAERVKRTAAKCRHHCSALVQDTCGGRRRLEPPPPLRNIVAIVVVVGGGDGGDDGVGGRSAAVHVGVRGRATGERTLSSSTAWCASKSSAAQPEHETPGRHARPPRPPTKSSRYNSSPAATWEAQTGILRLASVSSAAEADSGGWTRSLNVRGRPLPRAGASSPAQRHKHKVISIIAGKRRIALDRQKAANKISAVDRFCPASACASTHSARY